MRDLVLWLARELCENKDAVRVDAIERDRSTVFELTVDPSDLGREIRRPETQRHRPQLGGPGGIRRGELHPILDEAAGG